MHCIGCACVLIVICWPKMRFTDAFLIVFVQVSSSMAHRKEIYHALATQT